VDTEAEAIIRDIHHAFRGVSRGRITLHEAEVIDEYGSDEARAEACEIDIDERWEDVPDSHIEECTCALSHLDAASWRYYIAPYMIWAIRNFCTSDSIVSDYTIYTFCPSSKDPGLYEYSMERFRQLNDKQSAVVCRFLRYMAANGDHADDHVASEALQKYWSKFCLAQS
jgi:hypothetical protein